jgi:hypothetical protein
MVVIGKSSLLIILINTLKKTIMYLLAVSKILGKELYLTDLVTLLLKNVSNMLLK